MARVKNLDTEEIFDIVTTNGEEIDEALLDALRPNEIFVAGEGRAERTLFGFIDAMRANGVKLEILGGGTSRGMCILCVAAARQRGLTVGGDFPGYRPPNTRFRLFWR